MRFSLVFYDANHRHVSQRRLSAGSQSSTTRFNGIFWNGLEPSLNSGVLVVFNTASMGHLTELTGTKADTNHESLDHR
jgi:hypothetical protein